MVCLVDPFFQVSELTAQIKQFGKKNYELN